MHQILGSIKHTWSILRCCIRNLSDYCVNPDLNLATHLSVSAIGVDALTDTTQSSAIPIQFHPNNNIQDPTCSILVIIFKILPELQAIALILLSIVRLQCTIWFIIYIPSEISYVAMYSWKFEFIVYFGCLSKQHSTLKPQLS